MSDKKTTKFGFQPENYKFLIIGLALNVIGFLLMLGGATDDPSKFDGDALFSDMRITVSPMLILSGYVVIIYAIMKKQRPGVTAEENN